MGRGIYQQNCYCQFREQRPGHWFACAEKWNYRWLRCSSSFPRPKPKVAGGAPLQLGMSFASIMEICCRTENAPLSGLIMSP